VRDVETKLNNPRRCNTEKHVGAATSMTNSAIQLWEYICRECPDPSYRGYYDCGNNFIVHVLGTDKIDLFHENAIDGSIVPAKGNCAVCIEGQRGDHKNTSRKCYINGDDTKIYDAFIPKDAPGILYETNATIAPDWESLHGPHIGEGFYDTSDRTSDGRFHRIPLGSSFFIFMCYNFMPLLKEYIAANDNKFPEAITTEIYNELLAVSAEWPDIDIYERIDLVDDRPYQLGKVLYKNSSGYLWKCEAYSFNFCIPVKWAELCSRVFQSSANSLHCLMPARMAVELAYQKGYQRERDDDVILSGVFKAQAFIPFYCFYIMPDPQQQE